MGRRPGIDGRELIIAAALKLFSEEGVDGVSIRAVNREAGLGPASVHYHFGTKDALLDAVIQIHGDTVRRATKSRAQALVASDDPVDARDLVTMLAEPYLDLIQSHQQDGQAWMRVISHVTQGHPEGGVDRSLARATWRAASKVYPDASSEMVQRAMRMCTTLLVTQLAFSKRSSRSGSLDVEFLIEFLTAGLDGALRQAPPRSGASRAS